MNIAELLQRLGIPIESATRIRLGRGVVGKASLIAVVALVVLGVVAARSTHPLILGGIALLVTLISLVFLWKIMSFAKDNPAAALLEGAELLQWQQWELTAKGIALPPRTPPIEPPPKALQIGEE